MSNSVVYAILSGLLFVTIAESAALNGFTVTFSENNLRNERGIVGAFCFPHGAITLDPETRNFSGVPAVKPDSQEKCIKLHEAMKSQAEVLVSQKPELIILSTPHGLKLQNSYLLLRNKLAKGSAEWDGDWTDYTAQFRIDTDLSNLFFNKLSDSQNPVEILGVGDSVDALPLRWGEVIPWYFINEAAEKANFTLPPVVFIGQPSKRSLGTKPMIPELTKLGRDINQIILEDSQLNSKRIAIVVSSDLSHYHSTDPTSPYPYNPNSTVFDGFIEEWARLNYENEVIDQLTDKLTVKAGDAVDTAGSCGYTGLVMLHGLLGDSAQSGLKYNATLLEYSAPTYYGMMVNHWLPIPI